MELKQIKELMIAMEKGKIKKISIKEEKGFELSMEREDEKGQAPIVYHSTPMLHHEPHHHLLPSVTPPRHQASEEVSAKEKEKEGTYIVAPMVGTFYAAPSPEDPPYVKVGDQVQDSSIVCLVEAMKVMNEVKAGVSGVVAEVLVRNGQPVEYGTKLFRIV